MTPIERHERRMREIHEEYERDVARLHKQSKRDLRRILFISAGFIVLVNVVFAVIAWLLEGAGK